MSLPLNIPLKSIGRQAGRQTDSFYFRNSLKGPVMSLEFTNKGFEGPVQKGTEIRSMILNFESPMAVLSACAVREEVFAVSSTTDKVMKLLEPDLNASDQENDVLDQSAEEPISVSLYLGH
jgi:hypothetical protein